MENEEKVDVMKEMEGTETWTNAFGERFGERVCVLVEDRMCIHDGKKFKPTKKEVKDLWDDHIEQELGSKEQIERRLEEEFGWQRTATVEELVRKTDLTKEEAQEIYNGYHSEVKA